MIRGVNSKRFEWMIKCGEVVFNSSDHIGGVSKNSFDAVRGVSCNIPDGKNSNGFKEKG
jgi:hypothetical protein